MSLESVGAFFVLMAVVMGFATLPAFRLLDDEPQSRSRHSAIDGLRGFLALGVFAFHLVMTRGFIETGVWALPGTHFYAALGPVGVSVFFMLTGYLFWGKLLRANGHTRWSALYMGRLFRIAPMYLTVVIVMIAIVFARTGFELREPAWVVARSVLQWLALGLIDTQPAVNTYEAARVLAGVTWTIAYEWAFYAALLVIAPFARRRWHLAMVLAALALSVAAKMKWRIDAPGFAALFLIGMAVASLLHENIRPRLSEKAASLLALVCLALALSTGRSGYATSTALLLAGFFYLVCSGASLFGLLSTLPAQRLGRISYSLYLMQGPALTLVFAPGPIRAFALVSPVAYWVAGIACACLLVAAAALGYAFVERPGIAFGKHVIRRVQRRAAAARPMPSSQGRFKAPPPPESAESAGA
jgi:peptidoglycan/LPS O-acetylase OafA/YrhL